jgi:adenylylsulfate kinase-like enzyme
MTGVQDPYEEPADNELTLDTENNSADKCAGKIMYYLVERNYLRIPSSVKSSVATDAP